MSTLQKLPSDTKPQLKIVTEAVLSAQKQIALFNSYGSSLGSGIFEAAKTLNTYQGNSLEIAKSASQMLNNLAERFRELPLFYNKQIIDSISRLNAFPFPNFEPPEVGYMPPSSDYRLARIENRLIQLQEDRDLSEAEKEDTDLEDEDRIYIFPSNNKKYKVLKKMLNLIVRKKEGEVFYLAKCIEPKLTRKRFKGNKEVMKKVKIQEISTPGCVHCAEARKMLEQEIKKQFPQVDMEFIDMLSEKGQKMVAEHSIFASPGIIINGELFSAGELNKSKLIDKIKSLS